MHQALDQGLGEACTLFEGNFGWLRCIVPAHSEAHGHIGKDCNTWSASCPTGCVHRHAQGKGRPTPQ